MLPNTSLAYEMDSSISYSHLLRGVKVAAGDTAFSPEIESLIESDPRPQELTERQQLILEETSKGLSSEDIATKLGISTYAVNQHIDAVRRKLGAQNRTEAVAIAIKKQILKI